MTLRETLKVLAIKTDILDIRVFVPVVDFSAKVSCTECVDTIGFEDCGYPKNIIDSVDEKYLSCEVTYVEMSEDNGKDRMVIDIFRESKGRNIFLEEEQVEDVVNLLTSEMGKCFENGYNDCNSPYYSYYMSIWGARDAIAESEMVFA